MARFEVDERLFPKRITSQSESLHVRFPESGCPHAPCANEHLPTPRLKPSDENLSVGCRRKSRAFPDQLLAKSAEIVDLPVEYHDHLIATITDHGLVRAG